MKHITLFLLSSVALFLSSHSFAISNLNYVDIIEIKVGSYNEVYLSEDHSCSGTTKYRYDLSANDEQKLSILMMAFAANMRIRLEYICDSNTLHPKIVKVRVKK